MARNKKKPKRGQFGKPKRGKIRQPKSGIFGPGGTGTISQPQGVGSITPAPQNVPPAVGPTPEIPGWEADPGYQEAVSWGELQRQQADAQYKNELANLGLSTGLYDAQGNPLDQSQVEQLNPFSRAALLRRSWRQAQTGGLNSYAAAGQLYSGALKNAIGITGDLSERGGLYEDQRGGYNSFGYHQNLDALKGDYNQRKAELDRWRLGITGDVGERVMEASQGARDRFIEARPPAPPAPPPPPRVPTPRPTVASQQPQRPSRGPRIKPPPRRRRNRKPRRAGKFG